MADNTFFEEATEQSQIKARIVAKYFWAWANVVKGFAKEGRIAYIDLFSGPGRYKNGKESTPLMVLSSAIGDPEMRKLLVAIFNDSNPENARTLQTEIENLEGIETLKYKPQVHSREVDQELAVSLSRAQLVPTLFFIDPWGYKGLSLELVGSVLKNWGCDCIFFFNYNRINPALSHDNDLIRKHVNALFGETSADVLRTKIAEMNPAERELAIVEELAVGLHAVGGKYVLPFTFRSASGERTSHHLFLVTKGFKGYEIMKDIMASESSEATQGVPSFAYLAAGLSQPLLFELQRPLDDLEEMLLAKYAGKTLSRKQIYEDHSVGRPYVERNYREILIRMEKHGKILTNPPAENRRVRKGEVAFPDSVRVTFPRVSS